MSIKKLWKYPLIFGVIGVLIGLILRYHFIDTITFFSYKNLLHAHSHIMLLGFLFNAIFLLVWETFIVDIDTKTSKYFLALQVCMAIMVLAFIIQGYALFSIMFSTLHLWISYILLIRIWQRMRVVDGRSALIKIGIVFHFISSLGPYILGPLMVLGLKESPWYQQAIFFYLHFQFFGIFFIWLMAILLKKMNLNPSKIQILGLTIGLILTYAHSLDYSFDHWLIHLLGGLGSLFILLSLLSFKKGLQKSSNKVKFIYYIIVLISMANFAGSFPLIGQLVVDSRFMLIAWLHLLFLGLYIPFIWISLNFNIHKSIWFIYGVSVGLSEFILVFPNTISNWISISSFWLLFITYAGVAFAICAVHLRYLFLSKDNY